MSQHLNQKMSTSRGTIRGRIHPVECSTNLPASRPMVTGPRAVKVHRDTLSVEKLSTRPFKTRGRDNRERSTVEGNVGCIERELGPKLPTLQWTGMCCANKRGPFESWVVVVDINMKPSIPIRVLQHRHDRNFWDCSKHPEAIFGHFQKTTRRHRRTLLSVK